MSNKSNKSNKILKRSTTFVLGMGMLAGVLIWAKLRLVTDIPRSAYAEPDELSPNEDQSSKDSATLGLGESENADARQSTD